MKLDFLQVKLLIFPKYPYTLQAHGAKHILQTGIVQCRTTAHILSLEKEDSPISCFKLQDVGFLLIVCCLYSHSMMYTDCIFQIVF